MGCSKDVNFSLKNKNCNNILFSARIKRILNFIKTNYKNEITLQSAAEKLKLSKDHFNRIFKSKVGISFKKFLRILRIYKSAVKLRENFSISITDICFDVGFNDLSNFIRTFKNIIGCSPMKYKLCRINPEKCNLRRNSFLNRLASSSKLSAALGFPILFLCYIGRAKKLKNNDFYQD